MSTSAEIRALPISKLKIYIKENKLPIRNLQRYKKADRLMLAEEIIKELQAIQDAEEMVSLPGLPDFFLSKSVLQDFQEKNRSLFARLGSISMDPDVQNVLLAPYFQISSPISFSQPRIPSVVLSSPEAKDEEEMKGYTPPNIYPAGPRVVTEEEMKGYTPPNIYPAGPRVVVEEEEEDDDIPIQVSVEAGPHYDRSRDRAFIDDELRNIDARVPVIPEGDILSVLTQLQDKMTMGDDQSKVSMEEIETNIKRCLSLL